MPDGTMLKKTIPRKGIPIAMFSIEMDAMSLGYRLLAGRGNVSSGSYNQVSAAKDDRAHIEPAGQRLKDGAVLDRRHAGAEHR